MSWRIKTVTERTGVPAETLRSWERRYALVTPARSPSGYRQYSDSDVERIARVKALVDTGLAVSEAVERCRQEAKPPAPTDGGAGLRDGRSRLLRALLDLDDAAATNTLRDLSALPWETLVSSVVLPVDREASWLADQGQATAAEAAFVRGWLRDRVTALRVALGAGHAPLARAVVLREEGGSSLAEQAFALGLRLRGWRVTCVGLPLALVDAAPLLARDAPDQVLMILGEAAAPAAQRTTLARLDALAPRAGLLAHGLDPSAASDRVVALRDLTELPSP